MPSRKNVVRGTTKSVVSKTTESRPVEEFSREAAWQHLHTPPEHDPSEWEGELARVTSEFSVADRDLTSIAAKYDLVVQRARYRDPGMDETSVLAALLVIRTLRDKLEADERKLISTARTLKITWSRIGNALELKSRQAAERRFLQLRDDLEDVAGDVLTQAERVEVARARRDRRTEYTWATSHATPIISLALRLHAVSGLQQRADNSPAALAAYQRAANGAVFEGRPAPPPPRMPWPARLHEAVQTYRTHQQADREYRMRAAIPGPQEDTRPPAGLLAPVAFDRLVHDMFGLIGHALDINLHDHTDIVEDVQSLYKKAGPASPRALEK
ncbi:hypothetical protein [Streptomyces sp. RM72]|uniref:hypothetical protein n=1 Tax=Streptomyces sp. RM72 TaxID=1115510 RepID=UPI001B3706B9|nr:hypothetical protein [Streptomyces sp. RM72]